MLGETKFWLENMKFLFCSAQIVPLSNMNLEDQMNSLSRMVLIMFILFFLINWKSDIIFLIISLIFIIILYYIKKGMIRENFQKFEQPPKTYLKEEFGPTFSGYGPTLGPPVHEQNAMKNIRGVPIPTGNSGTKGVQIETNPFTACRFCDDELSLDNCVFNNPNYESLNQKLAGGPNPKTLVMPIIVPPIADTEFWKPNDFVIPRAINSESNVELYQSGYVIQNEECLPKADAVNRLAPHNINKCECQPRPNIAQSVAPSGGPSVASSVAQNGPSVGPSGASNVAQSVASSTPSGAPGVAPKVQNGGDVIEPFTNYFPYQTQGDCVGCCTGKSDCECDGCKKPNYIIGPNGPGLVLDPNGYDPHQLQLHNIPSNLPVGDCQQNNAFNCYNKDSTFTNVIQPGVYSRSEIIEPINSNIGISYTQQFEPVTCEKDCNGGTTFVSHDPRLIPVNNEPPKPIQESPNESNVYDPRFYGYGTSYRSYIEPVTGQARFYYDDIDAHRRSNYITRNKIDFTNFGTHVGPMVAEEFKNQSSVRTLANNQFANDQLKFRTDLQERLSRKINRNSWQQKTAPIYKTGQCWTKAGNGTNGAYNAGTSAQLNLSSGVPVHSGGGRDGYCRC